MLKGSMVDDESLRSVTDQSNEAAPRLKEDSVFIETGKLAQSARVVWIARISFERSQFGTPNPA